MQIFRDRYEAGLALADTLPGAVISDRATLIIGLAPGGAAVADALAKKLNVQLDVAIVQELELPGRPGYSVGAMVSGGLTVMDEAAMQHLNVSDEQLDRLTQRAAIEIRQLETLYRAGRPPLPVSGRTVILVDDGSASSLALLAAARALKPQGASKLMIALPMTTQRTLQELAVEADQVVCIALPATVGSPAKWYQSFPPVRDEEIRRIVESTAYEIKAAAAAT